MAALSVTRYTWVFCVFIFLAGFTQSAQERPPAGTAAGEAPFARSELVASTDKVRESETISYTLTVRISESEAPQQFTVRFPIPGPAMLVSASPRMMWDEADRELSWEGDITPGHDRTFTIKLVTLPESASNRILLSSASIHWRVRGMEWQVRSHWLQSEAAIFSKEIIHPVLYVLPNGIGIGKVEFVVLAYLVGVPLLTILIPWRIRWREKRCRSSFPELAKAKDSSIFLYVMSFSFSVLLGVVHLMGSIALEDFHRYLSYMKTECTVLDKKIVQETHRSNPGKGGSRLSTTTKINEPLVAVRYRAGNRDMVAAGPTQVTAMRSPSEKSAIKELAQYERGKSCPCWYDPQEPARFVLARGLSWGWYLLGAGPLLLLYLLARHLLKMIRV